MSFVPTSAKYYHKLTKRVAATISRLVDGRAGDRQVDDFRFDSRSCNAPLCFWERHFAYFPLNQAVYPLLCHSLRKDLQTP